MYISISIYTHLQYWQKFQISTWENKTFFGCACYPVTYPFWLGRWWWTEQHAHWCSRFCSWGSRHQAAQMMPRVARAAIRFEPPWDKAKAEIKEWAQRLGQYALLYLMHTYDFLFTYLLLYVICFVFFVWYSSLMTHFDLALPKSQSYIYNPCIVVHRFTIMVIASRVDVQHIRCFTFPMVFALLLAGWQHAWTCLCLWSQRILDRADWSETLAS